MSDTTSPRDLTKAARKGEAQIDEATYRATGTELASFIRRMENLAEQKAEISDAEKEVMAEAKARGYDTPTIRRILAQRKKTADEIAEAEAVMDLYKTALEGADL